MGKGNPADTESTAIDGMLDLFRGNVSVVGLDDAGHGTPGPALVPNASWKSWRSLMEGHLLGKAGIGVYPYNHHAAAVRWGCVDFDEGDTASWDYATRLRDVLRALSIDAWIERSRSKGYHVWVFAKEWTPAAWMRQALIAACDIGSIPHKEVNPKSETLDDDQLGNFVRLPYKGTFGGEPTDRQTIVDLNGVPLPPELFLPEAALMATEPFQFGEVARDYYVVPVRPRATVTAAEGPWMERLNRPALMALEDGPRYEGDRSGWLWRIGGYCAEDGLDEDETVEFLALADQRHTAKYAHRRDAETRYREIARKVRETQGGMP